MSLNALILSAHQGLTDNLRYQIERNADWRAICASNSDDATSQVARRRIHAIFVDLETDGFEPHVQQLLQWIGSQDVMIMPIFGLTQRGCSRELVTLVDQCVSEHFSLPVDPAKLHDLLEPKNGSMRWRRPQIVECRELRASGLTFVTRTQAMFSMLETLEHISTHDVTLLFIGETGTGKTYLATLVHELSGRRNGRFLTTACGALPPDLIESELFGHVRGAFTSADRTKVGRFEAAEGGTLLLDEIDVLGAKEQVKLLRVIETGEYEPVGSADTKSSNVRLIVASNVDLKGLTEKDKFRSDLYYRLNVLEFHLLPLRERPMDLVPLAMDFLDESCEEHSLAVDRVDVHFLRLLKHYHWPGNLRELKNQMRRAALFSKNRLVTADVLSHALLSANHDGLNGSSTSQIPGWNLNERMAQSEKEILEETLRAHNNNRTATARALGISRVGLYKKMRRFGLLPPKSTHLD